MVIVVVPMDMAVILPLAELQTKNKALNKPRNPIGFTAPQYTQ